MLNTDAKLVPDLLETDNLEQVPTRDGFGHGLVEAGKRDERVVALCADVTESTRVEWFAKEFPGRFIEMGVAEQNMAAVAAGMANYGKIPFIASYGTFSPGRNWEQIRTTICINNVPVKIAGSHTGVSVGPDGATHQALEDIALMRVLPNMVVVVPCDAQEARKATVAAAFNGKPSYIRLGREKSPVFTTKETPFEIGKATVLRGPESVEGLQSGNPSLQSSSGQLPPQVAIIGCGSVLYNALVAAEELSKTGTECIVINSATVKPLDEWTIMEAAKLCGAVVTVEEHQVAGGMGSAVAELLAQKCPVPIELVGVHDHFGESGKPEELLEHFGMGIGAIQSAVYNAIGRKRT